MHCICTLKKVLYSAAQEELNDASKRKSSSTIQNRVVNLNKISDLYPIYLTPPLSNKDTPFLRRLILNTLAKGLPLVSAPPLLAS
jgi:hypothetical protein